MSTSTEGLRSIISPRLLHTVGSLRKRAGGPSRTVTALCRELGRLGAQVELVSRGDAASAGADMLLPPAEWVTTTLAPDLLVPVLGSLVATGFRATTKDCCTRQQLQLIHDHGLWLPSNHASVSLARELGLPLIISPRGMLEPWALAHRAWKKRLAWRLYQYRDLRAAQVLHATSEQEAENLRRLGLCKPIALIPNGVEREGVADAQHPIHPGAAIEGAIAQRRNALFLGRIHPIKGLLTLVDAWCQVRPAGWRMVIAGPDEGGHRVAVEARIRAKGLADDFVFVGPVEGLEKSALYQESDLFILPSFSENFGVAVAEALSFRVPVIATKGSPWQGLETHCCGWWVELGVEPLAAALREATSAPSGELEAMGERGRVYAESNFGWQSIAQQMLGVYRWMLGEQGKPDCIHLD